MIDSNGLMVEVDGGKPLEAGPHKTERKPAAAAEEVDESEPSFHERAGVQCHSDSKATPDRMEAKKQKSENE
jgi:protein required for attachment to host cells